MMHILCVKSVLSLSAQIWQAVHTVGSVVQYSVVWFVGVVCKLVFRHPVVGTHVGLFEGCPVE